MTATMHTIPSKPQSSQVTLGLVPMAELELEGTSVKALLDTGSPVAIVSLEFLLDALAKRRQPEQTPAQWKKEVNQTLQPTQVSLRNYGGGQLSVVRQIEAQLSRASLSVHATIQVQKDAPTKLLIGTDLLPKLGFSLLRSDDDQKVDLLDDESSGKLKASEPNGEHKDAAVCLLRAVHVPGRHTKLVRAKITGKHNTLSCFEPSFNILTERGLCMAEAVVEPDDNNCVVMSLENHNCDPVQVEAGQLLGAVTEVTVCELQEGTVSTVNKDHFNESRLTSLEESLRLDSKCLTEEQVMRVSTLMKEYADVFALDSSELGSTNLVAHSINTGDTPPIKQPIRRIPFALRDTVDKMVQDMLMQGVVQPSHSPWSSPIVLVEKKDGSRRFCVDYRRLNAVTKMDVYPLPRIDDTLDSLAGSQYFTALDLASGFWQVKMDDNSREKTAFATPSGLYEFTVMPFGLCNSPATFQRLMTEVLSGLTPRVCMVYIDDVLVLGKTFDEHINNLQSVFERFRMAGLKLKPSKCCFGHGKVTYLGYVVSQQGISPDPSKVEAIRLFPQPRDIRSLRSFLGLASYYRRFISNFSIVANPLFTLTKKDVPYEWSEDCQRSFEALKCTLVEAPLLVYPDFSCPFSLETDAS